jgi:predicted acetyltransferase
MQKIKLDIDEIRPQQHFLDEGKLKKLQPLKEEYGDIFILVKDENYYCVDGHHRLFLMAKSDIKEVECLIDPVDQDSRLYHALAEEAEELGFHHILDLEQRTLSTEEFMIQWVGKCQNMLRSYRMEFVKISKELEKPFMQFNKEFEDAGEKVIPYAGGLHGKTFEEFLIITYKYEIGDLPDPTHVPSTTFFLLDEKKIVGAISIRHSLTDYLLKHGGHIGYGVVPSERGKGLATKMLEFGKKFLKDLGVDKALLTCDKENPASRKVIEKCGGFFEDEIESDKRITQRFRIQI